MGLIDRIKYQIKKSIETLDSQLEVERNLHIITWCKTRKAAYDNALDIIDYEVKQTLI